MTTEFFYSGLCCRCGVPIHLRTQKGKKQCSPVCLQCSDAVIEDEKTRLAQEAQSKDPWGEWQDMGGEG